MNVSGRILLIVCLFACLLQATGHGNGHGHEQRSLTFVCKEGWTLYEGDCYLVLNTPMTRDHASATCKRQGGDLFIPRNQQQFFDLEDGLPDTFWTGIQKDTDGSWRAGDNSVSLQSISLWADYEPDESKGSCVFMDRMNGAGIQNCDMMDYFVCQYEACLEGFVPCALGGKCIDASAAICDGVDDCVDKSDERNCSDSCKNFTKISADETFGEFSSGVHEGIDCWWSFEAPVGKRIQLSVPYLPLELNCGYLHILTGSPSVAESREIEWLTGPVSEHDVYSDNNFLHVRLFARDLSPLFSPQTFNWTTDIPNIMREEEILQASSEYQSLMFPFSSESLGPEMLSLYWKITVPEGEVISYHITSMSGESMVVAPVYIKDGDMDTYHSRMTDAYYTSATNNLIVRMQYSNTISDYVLYYKSGCNITISSMKGRIFSPGDTLSTIPHELTCEWTMYAGQNLSRGMSVKFPNIDLAMDPRQPPVDKTTQDLLQVYLDNSSSPEAPPVVFANDVGNIIHAPGGKIKIRFESDVTLNSKAFEVIFGIDCEPLSLSEETIISPMDTFYGEEVMLSCPTGYQFSLEKYKDEASVTLMCDTSGFIIGNNVVIPQCQIRRCGTPPKINNGFILEATSTSYEGEASYGCNQGFTMDGSPNITCNSAGRWTTTPRCTSSECSVSNNELTVENGGFEVEAGNNITGSFAEFNVVVKFYCNDGYELIGQLRTYCNTTSWDHDVPPTCRKLKCLLPEVVNAEPLASPTIEFNTSTEIQCKPGYEGSQMVTCLFNQTLDKEVTCTDIDECNGTNSCNNSTTKCMDTEGNYTCECLDGYMRVDDFTCTDILECNDNNGGCDFDCDELPGSYECRCDVGYDLFTEDGLHGYMIPESETGLLAGDLYRYNHTCVKKQCPPLLDVPYGQYLARNLANFHFMDQVTLRCDDGYHVTGLSDEVVEADVLCMSDGTWNSTLNCSARSCAIPDEPMYGMFDKTSVTFGETITLTCNYSAEEQVMQKAICIFDSGNMRLGGENINECPVIDCREPVLPDGGVYNGTAPSSTRFLDSPSFLFMCEPGYDRSGGSGNSTDSDLVVCQDNGRWSFGTLRCDGKKCTDPGTPVDAMQIVETYEIGKVLMYNCTRNGFKPLMGDVEKNYTCRYNNLTDTADWTDNLGRDNLPVCTDVTPPEVVTCPEDKEYFPMDTVVVTMPVFSDNFGINAESRSNYMETGDFIIGEQVFNYTVMDFENLMTSCLYTYRMLDRNDKPSLTCPSAETVEIMSDDDGIQEVKNLLIDYDSNATLNTDPTTFERTFSKIGSAQIARVSLTDGYGRTSECTFMIHFTAGTCFEDLLIEDSNAVRSCASTDDGLTCNSTCKSNYIYNDGSMMKTFNCSGTNNWVYPNVSDIYCLPIQNPAYLADVKLEYNVGFPAQSCLEDFNSTIDQELSQFEANIASLPVCDGVNWDITVSTPAALSGIFDFAVTLQLNLLSTDATTAEREACINQVEMMNNSVFSVTNNMLSCAAAGGSTSITLRTLELTPPILSCTSPSYSLREDTDIGDVCVPCGPGYFYNGSNGCSKCPSGEYQDEIDQSQCKSCLAGTAPNADQIACDNTCPPGFSSSSGFHPCEACPVDQFWEDSSTCQNCPEDTSTVGLQGAVNSSACYEPCPAGKYSETGYDVDGCTDCPNGFYQPVEGMTSCLECSPSQSTDGTPKTSVNDCTELDSCSGYGCDSNGTEQCEYHFHRPVCKCNPGYHGSKCEIQYEICSYDPCTEGSTCNQGEDNKNFTCTCRTDLDDCYIFVKSTGQEPDVSVSAYRTIFPVANQTECEKACLNDVQCLSALYTAPGTTEFCLLYNNSDIILKNTTSEAVYLEKNCTSAFGGTRCEKDLIDDCETAGCSSESMCMDKVNGSECLCPTDGGFSGPLCTQAIDVCDPDPCENGMCTAFGTVRYQCTCSEGYTGGTCDTLINECMFNPGVCLYNGTCSPEVGDYSCECVEGFSGDNCENTPDFCSSNDCLGNVCYSSLEFSEGVCTCEGPLFENVDPFTCNKSSNPCDFLDCENGGTCSNSADGLMATCSCMTGFTGHACQHNIDDCFDLACSGRGTCNDEVGGFNCSCDAGFEGEKCENNTNDCPGSCVNGTCIDGVDTFTCNCIEGFTGVFCEIDIDECVSCPCQHGGNCTQGIASYTCDCPVGWTGDNCENALDNCVDNKCQNDGRCFSILEKSICRCEGGTQGEFCENPADICEILSDADLCQNDAVCENKDGSAVCQCQTEYIFERCYFLEGEENTDRGNSYFNFSQSDSADYCKEECLKLENCVGVAFYQTFCFFYNQTSISPQNQMGSVLFKRVCPIDYSGDSCQFVKDHCANKDTCQNNGQCSSIIPRGFKCDCQEGYSGVVCQDAADPCDSDPCGNEATCRSTVTEYICQCPEGQVFNGSGCAAPKNRFGLLVNTLNGEETSCLATPFRLESNTFSLMMWVRFYAINMDAIALHLFSGSALIPKAEEANFDLKVREDGIVAKHKDNAMTALPYNTLFGDDLFDGEWHHIGIAVDTDGDMSSTIDARTSQDTASIGSNVMFNDSVQICLGKGVFAEYKNISVWDYYLSSGDFSLAKVNMFTPEKEPVQGWWNYLLQPSTIKLNSDLETSPAPDMTRIPPVLNCSGLISPVEEVLGFLGNSFVSLGSLSDVQNNLMEIEENNQGLTFRHTLPNELSWGHHDGIVIGMNEYNNYGQCRFPVYVKYNDKCPLPREQGVTNNVQYTTCDSGDGVCSLSCMDNNKGVSAPLPRYMTCSKLGVYDTQHPFDDLVLPACNDKASPKYVITASMQFEFKISCAAIGDSLPDDVQQVITDSFKSLRNTTWTDICDDSACLNLHFITTQCSEDINTPNRFDLEFELQLNKKNLSYIEGGSVYAEDAMRMIIKLDEQLSLATFGDGVLLADTVTVMQSEVCTTEGNALIWEGSTRVCVPCGPGRYYKGTRMDNDCVLCPRGMYQDELAQMMCKPCGNGTNGNPRTTYQMGAVNETECVEVCSPGKYYNEDDSMCMDCPRHYYQDEEGQNFCKPCDIGYKTINAGSNSSSECKEDCPAGQERDPDTEECVNCTRGFYRSLEYDNCQPCPGGRTTMIGEFGISMESCNMDNCPPGRYWNITAGECLDCELGTYQSDSAMLMCDRCQKNYTTKMEKSISADNCTFYCATGYEVNESQVETCMPCERGKYKDNIGSTRFDMCQSCDAGNTTDVIAAVSSDNCSIPICGRGEVIVNGSCVECGKDTFSDVELPFTSTTCEPCSDPCDTCGNLYGTNKTGAVNQSECILYCPAGFELKNGDCMECQRGFFKDNSDDESRFGMCEACSPDGSRTTDLMGAIGLANCTVPVCKAGQVVDGDNCTDCEENFYQAIEVPYTSTTCEACQPIGDVTTGTRLAGSNSSSDCLPICDGGKEFDNDTKTCVNCKMGTYKPASRKFDGCLPCNENYTTNGTGAMADSECNIRNCQPGTFINETTDDCQICPIGQYQDEPLKTSCKECGENLSTENEGANSSDACQVFCNPGLEGQPIPGTDEKRCEKCQEHFFKSEPGLAVCEECPPNFTSNENRTSCPDLFCYFGYQYNSSGDGSCDMCAEGFFKATKGNDDPCIQCEAGYTTNGTGQSVCSVRFCVPGEFFNNTAGDCSQCAIGSYKEVAGNQECTHCEANKTTQGTGSTMASQCDLSICPIGQYRDILEKNCTICAVNTFQDKIGQTSCQDCAVGFITLSPGSTDSSDCVPECQLGEQYIASSKTCTPCLEGTYKDTVGNEPNACKDCPTDRTTVGTGSISNANCTETVCPVGFYGNSSTGTVVCHPCPIGQYTSQGGQRSCSLCDPTRTTLDIASDSQGDCVVRCTAGHGYDVLAMECQPCPQGSFNDLTGDEPNICKVCPALLTNLRAGSAVCDQPIEDPPETTGFITVTVVLVYQISIDNCNDAKFEVIRNQIETRVQEHFINLSRDEFSNSQNTLCDDLTCNKINVVLIRNSCSRLQNGRRRRQLDHNIQASTTFTNVSATLVDSQDREYSFGDVLSRVLETDKAELTPTAGSIVYNSFTRPVTVPICSPGQIVVSGVCEPCGAGYFESEGVCFRCPFDNYQNQTGQTSCIECPENTFIDGLGSTSINACQSYCEANVLYCNNRGTCFVTGRRTARCECFENFNGAECQNKDEPASNMPAILGAAIGGSGGLLFIILIVVGLYKYLSVTDKKKTNRLSQDFPDPSPENDWKMYDNFSMMGGSNIPRPIAPYPSVGYPALGYHPDTSFEDVGVYNAYSKRPSANGDADHDVFVWQA